MKHRCSIIAALALAAGVMTLSTTAASARPPDDDRPQKSAIVPHDPPASEYNYPEREVATLDGPVVHKSSEDNGVEALAASASALGGAGVAVAGMWLHRRRQAHAA